MAYYELREILWDLDKALKSVEPEVGIQIEVSRGTGYEGTMYGRDDRWF